MAQTPAGQRLAIAVVLARNSGDLDGIGLLVAGMGRGEMAEVIESLAELAESGVRGRAGSAKAARDALVALAESIVGE